MDKFKQNWHSTLQTSPKALSYRLFKSDFRFEKYLDILNDKNRFNDDSFNVFGLLKKYFGIRFFLSVSKFGHCNT
jgi:acetone carboxylase gamma subunit